MRRIAALPLALAVGASVLVASARADQPPATTEGGCDASQSGKEPTVEDLIKCAGLTHGEGVGESSNAPLSSGSARASTTHYVPYSQLTTGPDGQPCVTTAWRAEGSAPVNEAPSEAPRPDRTTGDGTYSVYYDTYPPCPNQPAPPAGQSEPPDAIAARYWEDIPLPKPRPHIAPGWAITGKLAYLETNGELSHTYVKDTAIGPLEIRATGRYYVDWGDGESSGPHSVEGRPWPDGEITHDYIWARTYDILVTERWTATWRLAGASGTLRELRTTALIDDFPARQIQAVIR